MVNAALGDWELSVPVVDLAGGVLAQLERPATSTTGIVWASRAAAALVIGVGLGFGGGSLSKLGGDTTGQSEPGSQPPAELFASPVSAGLWIGYDDFDTDSVAEATP